MKYKYVGTIPAVILVEDSLSTIQPGDIVGLPVAPSFQFKEIRSDAENLKVLRNGPFNKKQKKDN